MTARASTFDPQRNLITLACRVLAARGLADGILGHISLRVDARRLLIRCRGPQERGLAYTSAEDIRLVDLDGIEDRPENSTAATPRRKSFLYIPRSCDRVPISMPSFMRIRLRQWRLTLRV